MKKILPAVALCSAFFIGCGGAEQPAAEAPAEGGAASELVSGYDLANGQEVYEANCGSCHDNNLGPKPGDVKAWEDRIAQGMDTIVKKSIEGFSGPDGMMPARGGAELTDDEVANAVAYMVNESVAR